MEAGQRAACRLAFRILIKERKAEFTGSMSGKYSVTSGSSSTRLFDLRNFLACLPRPATLSRDKAYSGLVTSSDVMLASCGAAFSPLYGCKTLPPLAQANFILDKNNTH